MGHHKYNPTAIAAKKGELPPKPKKISKREAERIIMKKIEDTIRPDPNVSYFTRDYFSKGDK